MTGGGNPVVLFPDSQSPTSSMAPGGSPGGTKPASLPTALTKVTALARVIAANNLLSLVHDLSYLASLNTQLLAGVPRNARDALDLAGKLPLAIIANRIGISPTELNIDPAQALLRGWTCTAALLYVHCCAVVRALLR